MGATSFGGIRGKAGLRAFASLGVGGNGGNGGARPAGIGAAPGVAAPMTRPGVVGPDTAPVLIALVLAEVAALVFLRVAFRNYHGG